MPSSRKRGVPRLAVDVDVDEHPLLLVDPGAAQHGHLATPKARLRR